MDYKNLVKQSKSLYGTSTYNPNHTSQPAVHFATKCSPENSILYDSWLEGERFFMAMKWNEARMIYSQCIKRDSSLCDAYFRLGQCYTATNNFVGSILIFREAEKRFPANPMVYLGLAQLNLMVDRPKEAIRYFEKMQLIDPENPEYAFGISSAFFKIRDYKTALHYYLIGRSKLPKVKVLNKDSGYPSYIRTKQLPPELSYLAVYEATLYYHLNETQKALSLLKNTTPFSNDKDVLGVLNYYKGLCYVAKGQMYYPQAKANLRRASKLGIDINPSVAKNVGLLIDPRSFKNLALSEIYFKNENIATDKSVRLKIKEADRKFENRLINESSILYSEVIKLDSSNHYAYLKIAECYHQQGNASEAIKFYKLAHLKFPFEITVSLSLAKEFFYMDSLNSALEMYNNAIMLNRNKYEGYFGVCLVLAHQGKIAESIDLLLKTKNLVEHSQQMALLEGILNYEKGSPQLALSALNTIHSPKDPTILYYKALSYHSLGENYSVRATEYLHNAIIHGAVVDVATEERLGLDPKVHTDTFLNR